MLDSKNNEKHYPDYPRPAVGAVVFSNGKVLLVKRKNAPGKNLWAIPGGSVRLGETLKQAVEREILEETRVRIKAREPVLTFDVIERDEKGKVRFHYVIVDFIADYISGDPAPADDALKAKWISETDFANLHVNPATRRLLKHNFDFG